VLSWSGSRLDPASETNVLEVENIQTYYGESHVLHGVSVMVAPGETVALLGRNGAGKTTLIRSVAGMTPPRDGRVVFDGEAVERWPAYRIARRGLALVPQGRRIFAPLSVRENLLLGARPGEWRLDKVYDLFPWLRKREEQSGGTLSGGEQQMLAIGRALMTNGRMLVLDEPSEGLAPLIVREIGRVVQGLKGGRLSILLVEQNYHLALRVADRVYVMSKGQIVWEGTPAGLEADEEIKRRFLGVAEAGGEA
jgi:branched-chain amino acid transport system ATP-binding protein